MKFTVNGIDYESWEDVPENFRHLLTSSGALPDGGVPAGDPQSSHTVTRMISAVTVDGVTYDSIDQVPEPMRSRLQSATGAGPQRWWRRNR